MTTIAWDGKMLAADRKADQEGFSYEVTKVIVHKKHHIFGAGNSSSVRRLAKWYTDGADISKMPEVVTRDDWEPIHILKPNGTLWRCERDGIMWQIESKYYACGSGRDYAIAAMHLGKTAKQAVELASIYDPATGLGVDVFRIGK